MVLQPLSLTTARDLGVLPRADVLDSVANVVPTATANAKRLIPQLVASVLSNQTLTLPFFQRVPPVTQVVSHMTTQRQIIFSGV